MKMGQYYLTILILIVEKEQKIVFLSRNPKAMTALFDIINGEREAQAGTYNWGVTITIAYLPLDNTKYF